MNSATSRTQLSDNDKDLLATAAVIGMGIVAVALFPNPVTIGQCAYHIGRMMGGRR
jgi:hypothetical protein